jgi:hypothetical protein
MPRRNAPPTWADMMMQGWIMAADASMVIALRSMRMMAGGAAANAEARRMLTEKLDASLELGQALATGRHQTPESATKTALGVYGKRVRSNRKRLAG